MTDRKIDESTRAKIIGFQQNEITEYHTYLALARRAKGKNREILTRIANDELRHYREWRKFSGSDIKARRFLTLFYRFAALLFGLTFAIKMMEKNEEAAEHGYGEVMKKIPEIEPIIQDEIEHEKLLVEMIDEKRIDYIGSMVLGLNDALVELTGALAGFTLAMQNTRLIGMAGMITGVAASLSMAASEYLSQKSEIESKNPLSAALYTGSTYIFVVVVLVLPFFLVTSYYLALGITLSAVILIILFFSYFVAVIKEISFRRFFLEMAGISMGVALVSFFIGWMARLLFKIEI